MTETQIRAILTSVKLNFDKMPDREVGKSLFPGFYSDKRFSLLLLDIFEDPKCIIKKFLQNKNKKVYIFLFIAKFIWTNKR